jgi:hypothetical protein
MRLIRLGGTVEKIAGLRQPQKLDLEIFELEELQSG